MYKSEAYNLLWEVFNAGVQCERAIAQERKCVSGSRKSQQYLKEAQKQRQIAVAIWDKLQWNFSDRPGSFTSTDLHCSQQ